MYPLNKAGLLGSALIALLIITSCSDSGTSTTGITPLSRDAAETGAINNAALKKEADHDHGPQGHESTGVANPGQGEGLGHQHGEPPDVVTTTTVLTLAAIPASRCGNSIQESGEQCDDGPSGSATCTANCTLKEGKGGEIVAESFCGDGVRVVSLGEQCDDGNSNNNDSCTTSCKKAACGDGYTQPSNGEQCDDKNKVDTDSCNNSCQRPDSTTAVTTTEETTTTTEDGNTRVTTIATDPDGNITTTDGPPLSCEDTCAALHSTEASYVSCKDECDSGSSSSSSRSSCPPLPQGTNTVPVSGYLSINEVFTYSCLDGYVASDYAHQQAWGMTISCYESMGVWSNPPPACTLSAEGESSSSSRSSCPPLPQGTNTVPVSGYLSINEVFTYSCLDGYVANDESAPHGMTISCYESMGVWSNPPPACTLSPAEVDSCVGDYDSSNCPEEDCEFQGGTWLPANDLYATGDFYDNCHFK